MNEYTYQVEQTARYGLAGYYPPPPFNHVVPLFLFPRVVNAMELPCSLDEKREISMTWYGYLRRRDYHCT